MVVVFLGDIMNYENYHKHTHRSNIFSPDTHTRPEEYCKRAKELGHKAYFTTEHGYGGDIFEAKQLCSEYGLKCIFAIEGYIVPDPLEKDNRNYHIALIARTNKGRRELNKASSLANRNGYYYKPRLFIDDLLKMSQDDVYITTACVAGFIRDADGVEKIFIPLMKHFKGSLFLELQPHTHPKQVEHNEKILELYEKYNKKYGISLISANDSHYISQEDSKRRDTLLSGKKIKYEDEDSFILDYPDINKLVSRYRKQGVLSDELIELAINNTNLFSECDEIDINFDSKMPSLYKEKNENEKFDMLKKLSYDNFEKIIIEDGISEKDLEKYHKEIESALSVVKETSEMHTSDYFMLDYHIVKDAIEKYGGILTRSGRGSCGAFYLNRLMGLTQLDRFTTTIPIYPDRFMSVARTLENRSYPDIDLNVVSQEPFVKASKDYLGELGCLPMLAYGTMQISESFRNVCRSKGMEFDEFNNVGKNIDSYRNDKKWKDLIKEAEEMENTVISGSIHPCSFLLFDGDIEEEIGIVKLGENYCAIITSDEAETWKYLKNDYLIVSVWDIISQVFKMINKPIFTLKELRDNIDDKVWDIYSNGLTCTINQVDSHWGTQLAKTYKPKSIEDVAKLGAAIRPSFNSWRDTFVNRIPYSNGVKEMDELLASTDSYMLYQENLMQYFEWLGITPAESIGLIKKISKKKIKQEDFDKLENGLKENWIIKTGSIDNFQKIWSMVQDCMAYSFNTPHALGYAYDSVYGAYLKSHYPYEYFAVVLNIYKDDQERTSKLLDEMRVFGLTVSPAKFRHAKSRYTFDRKNGVIYKGMESIKFLSEKCADGLYSLKDNKYDTFTDLLLDINKLEMDSRQLEILIKLEFFSEFGNIKELLTISNLFTFLKNGEAKQISAEKLDGFEYLRDIVIRNSELTESGKTYRKLDMKTILSECCDYIKEQKIKDIDIVTKITWQKDYLGYISFQSNKPSERHKLLVLELTPLKTRDKTKVYTTVLKCLSLGSGKINELKVWQSVFEKNKLHQYDIIFTKPQDYSSEEYNGVKSWRLAKYEKERKELQVDLV